MPKHAKYIAEIVNGRLAMAASIGMLIQDRLTGFASGSHALGLPRLTTATTRWMTTAATQWRL
eukprot:7652001-Heterocapsa_arctica.AAC.1